jgi:hypothetical protein
MNCPKCNGNDVREVKTEAGELKGLICVECGENINVISYTIQPTDSIRGIADRFGVPLDELVKLNPQVCTPGKQEGIEIKIPVSHELKLAIEGLKEPPKLNDFIITKEDIEKIRQL